MRAVITESNHYRDFSAAAMGGFIWTFGGVADGKHQRFLIKDKSQIFKNTFSHHVYKMNIETLEWTEHHQRLQAQRF